MLFIEGKMAQETTPKEKADTFWSKTIQPNEKVAVEITPDRCLIITNVCLGDYPDKPETSPIRLFANAEMPVGESNEHKRVLIASLIPGENEHLTTQVLFTSANSLELENVGGLQVHVSGHFTFYDEDEIEEEEEEEEDKKDKKKK